MIAQIPIKTIMARIRQPAGALQPARPGAGPSGMDGVTLEVEVRLLGLMEQVVGCGGRAPERLRELVRSNGLTVVARLTAEELERGHGLTRAQARRLAAAFAIGRRVESHRPRPRPLLTRPGDVYRLLLPEVRGIHREQFYALFLDARHRLTGSHGVSVGSLTSALVHPREVFGPALRRAAAAVIVAHNHPSGNPEPSAEDEALTRRLLEVGRLVGVPLLDHVVLGECAWVSLRERMGF